MKRFYSTTENWVDVEFCKFESKRPLSCMIQFLATEDPLRMMKNVFHFFLKALFVIRVFNFLSWRFGYAENRRDWRDTVNFKIYDVTAWKTDNCNAHVTQYLEK